MAETWTEEREKPAMKSGFVAVYGKANAGKSSLLNDILGFKLMAVSKRPQTTRENVLGIYNDAGAQIAFVDTPGIFSPHAKLGSALLRNSENAKDDADVLLFVVAAEEGIDRDIVERVAEARIPVVVAFNKIDLVRIDEGEAKLQKLQKLLPKAFFVHCSALQKYGVEDVVEAIKERLPEGLPLYPCDIATDRPREFVFAEFIREKCMRLLRQEVPHSIYVEVDAIEEDEEGVEVRGKIYVERESEKAIVIGRGGRMIAQISKYAEDAIHAYVRKPVFVRLLVKVAENWRNDAEFLRKHNLGGSGR